MALQLTAAATRVFSGSIGAEVLLGISVAKVSTGVPANIVSMSFNGTNFNKSPFKIKVATGDQGLVVVYVTTPGTMVSIEEVDAANASNRQMLAQTFFNPAKPSVTILIQGS